MRLPPSRRLLPGLGSSRFRSPFVIMGVGLVAAALPPLLWAASRPPAAVGAPLAGAAQSLHPTGEATRSGTGPAPSGLPQLRAAPAGVAAVALVAETPAPVSLRIPALRVDAAVDPVGLTPDGAVQVPDDGARTGWYAAGAAPQDGTGSTVLVGHVDTPAGPGALFRLSRAEPGQDVVVVDAAGAEHVYRVTGRAQLPKAELPAAGLFATGGPPRLVLISCGGGFDTATRHYSDNVVVVAEPLGAPSPGSGP